MALDPAVLKRVLRAADHPLGLKELLRETGLHPGQQTALKQVLRTLVREGLVRREGKRYATPHLAPHRESLSAGVPDARSRGSHLRTGRAAEPRPGERNVRGGRHTGRNGGEEARSVRGSHPPTGGPGRRRRAAAPRDDGPDVRGDRREGPRAETLRGGGEAPRGGGVTLRADREVSRGGGETSRGGGKASRGARSERRGDGSREGGARSVVDGPGTQVPRSVGGRSSARGSRAGAASPRPSPTEGDRLVEGTLGVHRDGYGFVHPAEGPDLFLPPLQAGRALDGDRVRVERVGGAGSTEGRLVEVIGRRREQVVGTYEERRGAAFVHPADPQLPGSIRVPPTQLARPGDVVSVRLGLGAALLGPGGLTGEVTGSLGRPGDPSQTVLGLAFAQGFAAAFDAEVMEEADRVPTRVPVEDPPTEGRRDLRGLSLVTIDGADARDFDDAVYAEEHGMGIRLWVAIADVTHYVRSGTALDREALNRGTSVYLPDRVLPMLPERLSNGICSLRPDEDRLCMVAELDFDASARRTSVALYPAVMRSAARCTYDEVQAVLDGEPAPGRDRFRPLFQRLLRLARQLRAMREERGALDFDLPETRVVLDDAGMPVRMERRERKESHRLVEECMLAANEAVAGFFQKHRLPSVYRFHGTPDADKLSAFAEVARAHGLSLPRGKTPDSRALNAFMRELVGHPERRALNQLLLRSMMQAIYSPDEVGHYGLAADEYLHFTSPIRRYPDLLVHRLLKAQWGREGRGRAQADVDGELDALRTMAQRSSERERAALQVERDVTAFYACLLMVDRVGEELAATVSSVVDFGCFVELDAEHVEGLVKLEVLGRGAKLDPVLHALVFPDGRRIRVGEPMRVRLVSVNLARRQMDFVPVVPGREPGSGPAPESPHPGFDRLRATRGKARPDRPRSARPGRGSRPPRRKR